MTLSPLSLALAALAVSGTANVIGYSWMMQRAAVEHAVPAGQSTPALRRSDVKPPALVAMVAPVANRQQAPDDTQPSAGEVASWLATATSDDPAMRGWAIWSLGSAHKADALPVLRSVVRTGSAEDRASALEALRTLAGEQGDADGAIRSVLRDALDHGDDDDALLTARNALHDVENQLAQASPPAKF